GKVKAAMQRLKMIVCSLFVLLITASTAHAGEADLAIPDLHVNVFFGNTVSAWWLLFCGAMVITGTLGISLYLRTQIHKLPAHRSMLNVAETIYQTCKTYLIQQGKFLLMLFALIAIAISYYLVGFGQETGHELTYRAIQEMRIEKVPEEVVHSLVPLLPHREKYKKDVAESKTPEEKEAAYKRYYERYVAAEKKAAQEGADKKLGKEDFLKALR